MSLLDKKVVQLLKEISSGSRALFSELAQSLVYEAFRELNDGNSEKGKDLIQQALAEDEAETRLHLGIRYRDSGEGELNLRRVIELRPDEHVPRSILGKFLLSDGKLEEAIVQFEEQARLGDVTGHIMAGECYLKLGRYEEAERAYRVAIELEPTWYWGYHHLGDIYFEQGMVDRGIEVYQQGIESDPDDANGRVTLAEHFTNQRKFAEAEPLLREALRLGPNITRTAQYKEDSWFKELMDLHLKGELRKWYLALLDCCFKQDKMQEAKAVCREAINHGYDDMENLLRILGPD